MNMFESFINGIISGVGMVIVMTVFGFLTFKITEKWIREKIAEISLYVRNSWEQAKAEGLKLDGIKIDGSLETKKIKKKKKEP